MKALLALALAAALGGPAWSQDAWRDADSNSCELNNNPGAHYYDPYRMNNEDRLDDSASEPSGLDPYGGETPSSEDLSGGSGRNPNGVQAPPDSRPQIFAPSANPDPGAKAASPFDEDLTEMNRRDRELDTEAEDRAYNPLKPPKEESPDAYGVSPFDAGRKPAESNVDPSGALGFDPYDSEAGGRRRPRRAAPALRRQQGSGAIGGDLGHSSAGSVIGPGLALPSLGPTTPGAQVH